MEKILLLGQKKEDEEDIDGGCEDEENSGDKEEEDNGDDDEGSEEEEDSGDDDEGSEEEEDSGDDEEGSEEEEDSTDDEEGSKEDEDSGDDKEGSEEGEDGEEEKEEMSQALDKNKKCINLPVPPKEKKQADILNLNNEVVKMRKEVKRVRTLIIRKLTRQIGALKKKKGKDAETEKNQRRADRLLGEIQAMKALLVDLVTKTALQKNLNFEQVCKDPKSTISDRAIARIATHPQFNKNIEKIKAAVKAFKEERLKTGKQGGKGKVQNQAIKTNPQSPDGKGGRTVKKDEKDSTKQQKKRTDNKEDDGILKGITAVTVATPEMETVNVPCSDDTSDIPKKEMPQSESLKLVLAKSIQVKKVVKNKPQSNDRERKPAEPETRKDEEESDLELSDDEEKEYFDDSTEERFHKQSSQSEESDNDFFVGKVSKFKKKKKKETEQKNVAGDEKHEVKNDMTSKVQSELDELESRLKSKATSLQSVFCSSLSRPKWRTGSGVAGRGIGWEKFRGQGKMKGGPNRDYCRQSKFQRQDKRTESNSSLSYSKPEGSLPESEKGFAPLGRGRGHGGGRMFSHQAPQQALHPSWEASKKRKQQQGQILAFQGKKIKFDDDD